MQNSLDHITLRQPLLERLDAHNSHLFAANKTDLPQLLAVLRQCDDARIGHLFAVIKPLTSMRDSSVPTCATGLTTTSRDAIAPVLLLSLTMSQLVNLPGHYL